MKSKATADGVAEPGPGITDARKQEEDKIGPDYVTLNGYAKVSSATPMQI